ncbi:hypothetical protein IAR55_005522 [Kwoniella newhampshirensis]|uniref:Peptidase S9 prolyl oligopeptidase catalytic domain-containing protein n=1 Tax=Kwoniella newhampshirensis TaxID=1651941 RepID=A0AAW0YTX9_9TREE
MSLRADFPPLTSLLPQAVPRDFTDHTYGVKHGVALTLRIWPSPSSSSSTPYLLWTHGGAYCTGAHYAPPSWVIPSFRAKGWHVIGIGFRLAPQVWIQDMVEDIQDASAWLHDYGPVNFLSPNFLRPPNPNPAPGTFEYSEDELASALEDRDPGNAILAAPFEWESRNVSEIEIQARWAVSPSVFSYTSRVKLQTAIKDYIGRRGPAVSVVLRLNDLEMEEERLERRKEWSAHHRARGDYPPTAFLHGLGDMAVPADQSKEFAEKLRGLGVEVFESYEEGVPHGFDQMYTGPEIAGWDRYVEPLVQFVDSKTRAG